MPNRNLDKYFLEFDIETGAGRGTTVHLRLPMAPKKTRKNGDNSRNLVLSGMIPLNHKLGRFAYEA